MYAIALKRFGRESFASASSLYLYFLLHLSRPLLKAMLLSFSLIAVPTSNAKAADPLYDQIYLASGNAAALNFYQWAWYLNKVTGVKSPAPSEVGMSASQALVATPLSSWWKVMIDSGWLAQRGLIQAVPPSDPLYNQIYLASGNAAALNFYQWAWYFNKVTGVRSPAPSEVGMSESQALVATPLINWWNVMTNSGWFQRNLPPSPPPLPPPPPSAPPQLVANGLTVVQNDLAGTVIEVYGVFPEAPAFPQGRTKDMVYEITPQGTNCALSARLFESDRLLRVQLNGHSSKRTCTIIVNRTGKGQASQSIAIPFGYLDPSLVPWWDHWPRFTHNDRYADVSAVNANAMTVASGAADEGRGPYFREISFQSGQADRNTAKANGMKMLAWIEGQGESGTIIGAVNVSGGKYQIDPLTSAARLIAHSWNWDLVGPGVNPLANKVVWMGVHSYVNQEDWVGPYTRTNTEFYTSEPKYYNGAAAVGYVNNNVSDPRNALLYHAIGSKNLNGEVSASYFYSGSVSNGRIPVLQSDGSTKYAGQIVFGKDQASPWWIEYNLSAAKYFIKRGMDGFWVDNYSGWDFIGNSPVDVAFGDWSVQSFRAYLASHPEVGIPDPSQFDIRMYLKAKFRAYKYETDKIVDANPDNLKDWVWGYEKWMTDPVWKAYLVFKAELAGKRAQELYNGIKNQATLNGRKPADIYVGANDIPAALYGALKGTEFDMVDTEYSPGWAVDTGSKGRGLPPVGNSGPFYSLATNLSQSRHAVVWYYLDSPYEKYLNRPRLGEVLGYEALAHNAILNSGDFGGRYAGTRDSALKVNQTIQALTPVFGLREKRGRIAILYSSETQYLHMTPRGLFNSNDQPNTLGYYGWAAAVEDLNLPYRTIIDYKLNLQELNGISVLILPHVYSVSKETVNNVLIPFARRGGAIVITGDNAGAYGSKTTLYKTHGTSLLKNLKDTNVSPGRVYFTAANLGYDYHIDPDNATKRQNIGAVLDELKRTGHYQPEVVLKSVNSRILLTLNENTHTKKIFVDLANKHMHLDGDIIYSYVGGQLTVTLPSGWSPNLVSVSFYDSDNLRETALSYGVASTNSVLISVPPFRVYGTLVIKKK